ncbi:MAG: ABC transporter permease [Pseudomonadota bacterium]
MLGATLLLALREIRRHLMRSILTTLGIVIGVAAVVTMVTFGNGVTSQVQDDIASLGSSNFIIWPKNDDRSSGRPFDLADVAAVEQQIAGVETAAGNIGSSATAFYNGQDLKTSIVGVNTNFLRARSLRIAEGRAFSSDEEIAGRNVCLLGDRVRQEIFLPGVSPIGEDMRLGDVSCTVIGVLETRGQSGGGEDLDDRVYLPLKTVQRRFRGTTDIDYFIVKYDSTYAGSAIRASLTRLLRERRILEAAEPNDFNIIDTAQINEAVSETTGTLTAMMAIIASISLFVGGVGIMNIMLVSVTERTREIGIRLAIGALASEVRLQFLTEAVVLCSLGGLVGLILAFGATYVVTEAMNVPFIFNPAINIISFLFAAVMGVVFGYYPARRASQLNPIDALRHE